MIALLIKPGCILIKPVQGPGKSQMRCSLVLMIEQLHPGTAVEVPLPGVAGGVSKCVINVSSGLEQGHMPCYLTLWRKRTTSITIKHFCHCACWKDQIKARPLSCQYKMQKVRGYYQNCTASEEGIQSQFKDEDLKIEMIKTGDKKCHTETLWAQKTEDWSKVVQPSSSCSLLQALERCEEITNGHMEDRK